MKTRRIYVGRALLRQIAVMSLLTVGAALACAQTPSVPPTDEGPDPALANMAPVTAQDSPYAPGDDSYNQPPAPLPDDSATSGAAALSTVQLSPNQAAQLGANEVSFLTQSDQPPPNLPDYDQPDAPQDNDIWNPGYWALGSVGYFWVPGYWVPAPFYRALWTPPYWAFYRGHYVFHPGYWSTHVGFYGGINYGFGYIGTGYFGGYWSGRNFVYNLAVTHVRNTISSVYTRKVLYRGIHYGARPVNRISFNGRGGIAARPRPAERVAATEPHMAPTFLQSNRVDVNMRHPSNYFSQNHGQLPPPIIHLHASGVAIPPEGNPRTATTTTVPGAYDPQRLPPVHATSTVTAYRKEPAETLEDARQAEREDGTRRQQSVEQTKARMESRQAQGRSDFSTVTSRSPYTSATTAIQGTEPTRINPPQPISSAHQSVTPMRTLHSEQAPPTRQAEHPTEEKHPEPTEHPQAGTVTTVIHGTETHREPDPRPEPPKTEPQRPAPPKPQPAPVQPHARPH